MRFEIVVAPLPSYSEGHLPHPPTEPRPQAPLEEEPPTPRDRRHAREVLDVFIDSANAATHARETHAACVLRDLALALVDLAPRSRAKATIRAHDEPWELCVERFGATACLSVYRTGADPFVAIYDRAVPFDDVVAATRGAIERRFPHGETRAKASIAMDLAFAAEQLSAIGSPADADDGDASSLPERVPVVVEPDRDAPLSFGAEFSIRDTSQRAGDPEASETGRSRRPREPEPTAVLYEA